MKLEIFENPSALGGGASHLAASAINSAIRKNGEARIVLSTGMSQFETLASRPASGSILMSALSRLFLSKHSSQLKGI